MDVEQFDFVLPDELIAQSPLKSRTASRLLSLNKFTGEITHKKFEDFITYLQPGDTLVLNDTKVIPARLLGTKQETGAKVEVLLLKSIGEDTWEALVRPAKKLKLGSVIEFGLTELSSLPLMKAMVTAESEMGERQLKFSYQGIFNELLDQLGLMPLPPYIKEQLEEKERYQTVYARVEGSAAAPTAGLHFTEDYLKQIRDKGINITYVTLQVGLGTFRPVSVGRVEEHQMHEEYYELSSETADIINHTRANGGRIIAVGTTSARTLETAAQQIRPELNRLEACSGWTGIFIYPGYQFKVVDALLTNFHLPKSTLMMLISAFADREKVMTAYQEAIAEKYRFFSFGDAMYLY